MDHKLTPTNPKDAGVKEQLLHALAQSQTLIDALHRYSAITVTDTAGHITYANPLFLKASGYTLTELLGGSHKIVNSGVHPAAFWQTMWSTISAGNTWRDVICDRAKDGNLFWYDTQISPMLDAKGRIEQYVSLRTDITTQVQANEAAQKATLIKTQFLANMSHEIRTPMNAILGMLKLLDATPVTPLQVDYLSKAEVAGRQLLGLINQILDFSKIDASKMALDCQPFNLTCLMQQIFDMVQAILGDKQVQVHLDLDPALPTNFVGDALRLQQVLLNLGGNAVKFTARGHITLQVRLLAQSTTEATLRLAVRDTGIGIRPESQQLIFDSFAQAQASTTREFGGTGLGLTIAQKLVGLMGAELKLESTLGQGSTFFFDLTLPSASPTVLPAPLPTFDQVKALPAESAATEVQCRKPALARPLTGLRLLVVEDNAINQMVARELLSARGAWVEIAENGQLGVAAVAAAAPPFDAVLMDIQMPVMNGYEATRAIRSDLGLATLPIIGLTANALNSDRDACLAVGMNAHVGKPIDVNTLVETLLKHTYLGINSSSIPHQICNGSYQRYSINELEQDDS